MTIIPQEVHRPPTAPGWATPVVMRGLCYWQARDAQVDRMWRLYAPDGGVVGATYSVLELVDPTRTTGGTRYSYTLTDPDTQPPTTLYATRLLAWTALVERAAAKAAV